MNKLVVCVLFGLLVVGYSFPEETYTDEFDQIDIEEILSNKRLVDNYLHCAKTGQKCTPDAQKARELFPDALQTKCSKCTETQRVKTQRILEWVIEHRPEDFLDLESQFDAEHKYRQQYADELKARNIILPPLK